MKPLGITKERELIREFRRFASDAAFLLLADSLEPMMVSLSRKLCRKRPEVEFDEAMQAALRGLWMAISDWKPRFNTRLATRAFSKIRTQHRLLVKETARFYANGRLETRPFDHSDCDPVLKADQERSKSSEGTKQRQQRRELLQAIAQLTPTQQNSLIRAGLLSTTRMNEFDPNGSPSKWRKLKAVKELKRIILKDTGRLRNSL